MFIKDRISNDIKRAMKESKPIVRDALRFVVSNVKTIELDTNKPATDEVYITALKKAIKQNEETLEYKPANEKILKSEIYVWKYYLPKQLSEKLVQDS